MDFNPSAALFPSDPFLMDGRTSFQPRTDRSGDEPSCIRTLSRLRLILIFLFILAFIENILHIIYYLLFDKNSTMCRKVELAFGNSVCVTPHLPIDHHSSFASAILALFHFMIALMALGIATSYDGTISELVSSTDPELLVIHHRMSEEGFVKIEASGLNQQEIVETNIAKSVVEDITKLPEGTKFKTSSDKTFNMEYYMENGVFVGTRTEKTNKTINIRAPTRPPRRRESSPKVRFRLDYRTLLACKYVGDLASIAYQQKLHQAAGCAQFRDHIYAQMKFCFKSYRLHADRRRPAFLEIQMCYFSN
ncbi:unnamed protein product [Angiostrongylus costaricensis]|uniref:Uncharacterized protein n=1 Tax=Angiostrongylus costaricensis TaxID=334426 RepID=A0A0R3PGV5_ANGCS|nr:unnamed protein product [Angiostrongylus costaricensis]